MDTITTAAPTPPAPTVTPIATATPPVTPTAPVVQAAPQFPQQQTPSGNRNIKDILKSLNLTEMCFGILGAAALYYTIYYYKYNITAKKGFINDIENKMDELTIKVADVSSALERDSPSSSPSGGGMFG